MPPRADVPRIVVHPGELIAVSSSPREMCPIAGSRMFEVRDALTAYTRSNPDAEVFDASQGDGGASLPGVSPEILDEAHRMLCDHGTAYDKPAGAEAFRRSVVEEYWQLDRAAGWGPDNVTAAQGGRDALLKAYDAAQFLGHGRWGDFVLTSAVPWISYNWGPYAIGANVLHAPGDADDGWAITPAGVRASVELAQTMDRRLAVLIITSPDNPTGRTASELDQVELARAAFAAGVPYVIFDWIYHRVTDGEPHDLNRVLDALSSEERDRCIFLDGITKSLGGSNIRNAHLVASTEVVKFIARRASHGVIPSYHSQAVAMASYRRGFAEVAAVVNEPTHASRLLVGAFLNEHDIRHVIGNGYYAFIDVGRWIDAAGVSDAVALGTRLAEEHGLALVPGSHFSEAAARWIRFSYALAPETTEAALCRMWEGLNAVAAGAEDLRARH